MFSQLGVSHFENFFFKLDIVKWGTRNNSKISQLSLLSSEKSDTRKRDGRCWHSQHDLMMTSISISQKVKKSSIASSKRKKQAINLQGNSSVEIDRCLDVFFNYQNATIERVCVYCGYGYDCCLLTVYHPSLTHFTPSFLVIIDAAGKFVIEKSNRNV